MYTTSKSSMVSPTSTADLSQDSRRNVDPSMLSSKRELLGRGDQTSRKHLTISKKLSQRHPDTTRPFLLEADSSDFTRGAILSQRDEDNTLHPVTFLSKTLTPAERNYDIYDKELLAIVGALKAWRAYLEGSPHPITILTDHKNLEYFTTTKELSQQQAHWAEFLSHFNLEIHYRPGRKAGKPDALSRLSQHHPGPEGQPRGVILPRHLFVHAISTISSDDALLNRIRKAYKQDTSLEPILAFLHHNPHEAPAHLQKKMADYTLDQGVLLYQGLIRVPNRDDIK